MRPLYHIHFLLYILYTLEQNSLLSLHFLLEFVLGYGSGHFYMGNILLATIKMIYTSITCLLFCQHNSLKKITEYKRIAVPLERFAVFGWIIWQIVDGILIFFGFYNDGNGHELKGL